MKLELIAGKLGDVEGDALVLGLYDATPPYDGESTGLDPATRSLIQALVDREEFKPDLNETLTLITAEPMRRLVLVGLGKPAEMTVDRLRQAAGSAARAARGAHAKRVAMALPAEMAPETWAQAIAEGVLMGLYHYAEYKSDQTRKELPKPVESLQLVVPSIEPAMRQGLERGRLIAEAVCWIRDLTNRPGGQLKTRDMVHEAQTMAKSRPIACKVFGKAELEQMGAGCLLGVNAGSSEPPALIVLEYWGGKQGDRPYALVGKGLTFDSGGLCIKPAEGMEEMKTDMGGAGAAMGAIRALADLKAPVNVVAILACTDNMPSGSATHPGDVLKSLKGLTMEIVDTDAEGRVVLADALAYADMHYDPAATLDMATLTGSIIVALGGLVTGMFCNDETLSARLYETGQYTGERVWAMPLWDAYDEMIESAIADVKNADIRKGDAIAAAKLLQRFAGDRPWAHLDIAGPSWIDHDRPYEEKGATGHGVRLCVEFLLRYGATGSLKPRTKLAKRG